MSNTRDGRPWKKDSQTQWNGFDDVRYSDCSGSYECVNSNCDFKIEYGIINRTQFDKKSNICRICRTPGNHVQCSARRYIAFSCRKTRVYHRGEHTCPLNVAEERAKEEIQKQLLENPNLTPSQIQSNLILSQMRQGKTLQPNIFVY